MITEARSRPVADEALAVELIGITKTFPGVIANEDVNLAVRAGEIHAIVGENGAGKSTVVAAIAGLLPLDEGHITLDGRTLDDPGGNVLMPAEDRSIGVVFQDYVLFPHLTVVENVEFGLRSRKTPRREARERAIEWLERIGLDDLADRKPGDLSGGQAQRVALARALITGPELLLLDEPLAALDATTRVDLRRTLGDHLNQFSGPRMVITHDPTEAFLLADEIRQLGAMVQDRFKIDPDMEASVEIDPRRLTREKLVALREVGFNRASIGVQDNNPVVQKAVHRIQPLELTREHIEEARRLGFTSVNVDLIYGLPLQTEDSFRRTVRRVIDELNPDRVACFSYAHVPWIKPHQRRLDGESLRRDQFSPASVER